MKDIQDFEFNKWCLMYQKGHFGTPFIEQSFKTKEEAIQALEERMELYRTDPCFQRDCNRDNNVVLQLGDTFYKHMIRHDKGWVFSYMWIEERESNPQWLQDLKDRTAEDTGEWITIEEFLKRDD